SSGRAGSPALRRSGRSCGHAHAGELRSWEAQPGSTEWTDRRASEPGHGDSGVGDGRRTDEVWAIRYAAGAGVSSEFSPHYKGARVATGRVGEIQLPSPAVTLKGPPTMRRAALGCLLLWVAVIAGAPAARAQQKHPAEEKGIKSLEATIPTAL